MKYVYISSSYKTYSVQRATYKMADIILTYEEFDVCVEALTVLMTVLNSLPDIATESSRTSTVALCARETLDTLTNEGLEVVLNVLASELLSCGWDVSSRQFASVVPVSDLCNKIDTILDNLVAA